MVRNFSLLLVGFLVGAATVHFVRSAPESGGLSERVEAPAAGSRTSEETGRFRLRQAPPGQAAGQGDPGAESIGPGGVVRIAADGPEGPSDESAAFSDGLAAQGIGVPRQGDGASSGPARAGTGERQSAALPAAYRSLLEPPNPRRLRPDEVFSRFATEARDEAWAYPMELGINQHIASMRNTGTVIESVECRQTACIIAGYSVAGAGDEWRGALQGMTQAGWWQATGPTMFLSAAGDDGVARFVTMHPRTAADAMEFSGAELPAVPGDPNAQNLGIVVTTTR